MNIHFVAITTIHRRQIFPDFSLYYCYDISVYHLNVCYFYNQWKWCEKSWKYSRFGNASSISFLRIFVCVVICMFIVFSCYGHSTCTQIALGPRLNQKYARNTLNIQGKFSLDYNFSVFLAFFSSENGENITYLLICFFVSINYNIQFNQNFCSHNYSNDLTFFLASREIAS